MPRAKPVLACDCETDPFLYGRVPEPFIWGLYDGKRFQTFDKTANFVAAVQDRSIILYAHNGGKFDYMFLLKYIKETKAQIINGRIVSMFLGHCELRDSYSIIPEPLRNFGDKKEIEYWHLEKEHRAKYREEILEYLFYDCKILYDAVTQYRYIAGTHKTIASNALAFATKLGIDVGKTSHRFDEKYRPFYFGGRCECFKPGTHENIHLLDIHSAYPYAMLHDHATGSNFVRRNSLEGMTKEEIDRSFIVIECTSNGAFPMRTREGLSFPVEYNEFHITGWEYNVAKEFGLIDNEKILEVRYTGDTINFKAYINHWYAHKLSHDKKTDPVNYTIGKRMMNSLYGKLAQNPARYYDYKIVEAGTRLDNKEGWQLHVEYEGHEIHRRESLWKYKFRYGVEWEAKGIYNNVASGASITGFTRAHLLRDMCLLGRDNIIYCDTDGIICRDTSDLTRLSFTDAIGDWEHEDTAPIGHFAGKKLYGIRLSKSDKDGNRLTKIASKGSKLSYGDLERIINGETIEWLNQAPSFSIDGSAQFVRRNIRATAHSPTPKKAPAN
jgi:hypothetical protein